MEPFVTIPLTRDEKVVVFASWLEREQIRGLIARGWACEANRLECVTKIKPGTKYTKVDVGTSGKYMIDNATGEIFGIKGYGVIHRGHRFGTLDTIHEWDWSGYRAVRKQEAH